MQLFVTGQSHLTQSLESIEAGCVNFQVKLCYNEVTTDIANKQLGIHNMAVLY